MIPWLCLLHLAAAQAAPPAESATVDAASSSSAVGRWNVNLQGGYPWSALRAQGGVYTRLTVFGEVDTALFRRVQPTVGLNVLLVGGRVGRLTTELGLGWQAQWGELPQTGASAVVRVRGTLTGGRVSAYLQGATRHTLLADRTRILRVDDEEITWSYRHGWTPSGQVGLAARLTPAVGLELGLGFRAADVGVYAFSLPTFHLGVHVGGGR